ncbi:hypothetical protein M8J76_002168 [Diaphorina citri]|nr:hypothetical protein M8J75_013211 [Diaphorina citri]KAI5736326.1 hypothetical protein M8J76_002168 [Diaphorina citri]
MFCWPCVLFSQLRPSNFSQINTGLSDVSNYALHQKRHSATKVHISCVAKLAKFGRIRIETEVSTAYKLSIEKHNETVKNNRYVITRLIDTVCFLGKLELAFRGHNEGSSSENRGNYIELLHFISQSDSVLAQHLKSATIFSGTSSDIQNDLIESISPVITLNIKREISQCNFVSLIVDETTDVTHKSQLSTVLRYVADNKVQERFLKFENVSNNKTGAALFEIVENTLKEFECGDKLVCQTYDGAAVMAGAHNGLQKLVKDKHPNAIFVHCYAHKLNLVLQQSVNCIKSCKIFFQTASGFSTFFSKSSGRTVALEQVVKRKFPTVAPTRWFYTHRHIAVLSEVQEELKTLLKDMTENVEAWDVDTRMAARGFLYTLEQREFKFLLKLFSLVLPKADVLFSVLQKKSYDIGFCNKKFQALSQKSLS